MKYFMIAFLVILFAVNPVPVGWYGVSTVTAADELWKVDFDNICGQTENAVELSPDEINKMIVKCDALKPRIEGLEASPRKIYLKRLQMCRNLFVYLLETKEKK